MSAFHQLPKEERRALLKLVTDNQKLFTRFVKQTVSIAFHSDPAILVMWGAAFTCIYNTILPHICKDTGIPLQKAQDVTAAICEIVEEWVERAVEVQDADEMKRIRISSDAIMCSPPTDTNDLDAIDNATEQAIKETGVPRLTSHVIDQLMKGKGDE